MLFQEIVKDYEEVILRPKQVKKEDRDKLIELLHEIIYNTPTQLVVRLDEQRRITSGQILVGQKSIESAQTSPEPGSPKPESVESAQKSPEPQLHSLIHTKNSEIPLNLALNYFDRKPKDFSNRRKYKLWVFDRRLIVGLDQFPLEVEYERTSEPISVEVPMKIDFELRDLLKLYLHVRGLRHYHNRRILFSLDPQLGARINLAQKA